MWGFTVDDALIPVRYAHNFAAGVGYRFDAHGPSTDGVTPLPWALLLRPLVAADPMVTLVRVKVLGVVLWTLGGGALGARVGQMLRGDDARPIHAVFGAAALLVMGLAFPLGAWAGSGMETGLAMALATLAVTKLDKPSQASVLAGLVAAIRPEMVVWAAALSLGAAVRASSRPAGSEQGAERGARDEAPAGAAESHVAPHGWSALRSLLPSPVALAVLAVLPFAICAVVRLVVFGRVAPLSVLAKPSDVTHGAVYVGAASLVVLTPLLACAPVALARRRELALARAVVIAFVAHALAVLAAGGDWMPFARLMVPVAPSLVLAFVDVALVTKPVWSIVRLVLAATLGILLAVRAAPAGRGVLADRQELVARARPVLADARVVAALDIGWVSAATDARIVDLAGLTDPSIALLRGGHTSKRVDVVMLLDRGVDTVVVYSDARVVERRIVRSELFASRFVAGAVLPLGSRGRSYTIYRRRR